MNRGAELMFLVASLMTAACGSNAEGDFSQGHGDEIVAREIHVTGTENDSSPDQPVRVTQEEVLAVVEAGGETYTFFLLGEGEDAALGMSVQGTGGSGSSFQGLLDREGDLTLLEIFNAIAPDREAPEALLQSHPIETAAMNRGDARVRSIEKAVPPPGVDVCSNVIFFPPSLTWTNIRIGVAGSGGNAYACVTNSASSGLASGQPSSSTCTFTSTLRMMAGICNLSTTAMLTYSGSGSATTWVTSSNQTLPGGEYVRYNFAASSTPRRLAAVGLQAFGAGLAFGLRSGTAQ
jgi:hypothetical protein